MSLPFVLSVMSSSSVHVISVFFAFYWVVLAIFCKDSCYLRVLKPINKQGFVFDEPLLIGHPLSRCHLAIPQGWLLDRGLTVITAFTVKPIFRCLIIRWAVKTSAGPFFSEAFFFTNVQNFLFLWSLKELQA